MPRKYGTMFERLVANSEKPDDQNENGCWLWTGKRDRRGEYGHLNTWVDGKVKVVKAHRVMANLFRGAPLTEEETVDHICWSGLCINPDHMHDEPVTREENSRRSQERYRRLPGGVT